MGNQEKGFSLEDLNRSWPASFKGGWYTKPVEKKYWTHPPTGILELNFDGNYLPKIQRGGVGGVIRDCTGYLVR